MNFRVTEILDMIIEVEQIDTGHRMTFCIRDDKGDIARGSFHENSAASGQMTKDCWRGAYLHARRAAISAGLLRMERALQPGYS